MRDATRTFVKELVLRINTQAQIMELFADIEDEFGPDIVNFAILSFTTVGGTQTIFKSKRPGAKNIASGILAVVEKTEMHTFFDCLFDIGLERGVFRNGVRRSDIVPA